MQSRGGDQPILQRIFFQIQHFKSTVNEGKYVQRKVSWLARGRETMSDVELVRKKRLLGMEKRLCVCVEWGGEGERTLVLPSEF